MVPGVSWDRTDISNIFQQITVGYALTRAREGGGQILPFRHVFRRYQRSTRFIFTSFPVPAPKWTAHLLKKRNWKPIGLFGTPPIFWSWGDVNSKNDPPGHTGALLVTMPRRQYELFIVVVKLNVVERRARRHLKALIKTYLIHA